MIRRTKLTFEAQRWKAEEALAREGVSIMVCAGTGCIAGGSLEVYEELRRICAEKGLAVSVSFSEHADDAIHLKKTGCHGFCEIGPLVNIMPQDIFYTHVKPSDCAEIIEKTIMNGQIIKRLLYKMNGKSYATQEEVPFYNKQHRIVLERCGHMDAESIWEYIARGGYKAFEKALFDLTDEQICIEMLTSGLRGRGGGGFPTGKKWDSVRRQPSGEKYVVCNGDEGDPGAFMDRSIMEGNPHSVIEGMMIAAIAVGAQKGYIYVRAEYPLAVERLQTAIDQARDVGLLGENILGTEFSFDIRINRGAGAFVCGEGSALTASIEGNRGMPRTKPPRTVEKGLWAKPTVLNNVETFAAVPLIIEHGAAWFRQVGTAGSPGTKAFALTGNVVNTGLIEVPMGTTLREIIFDIGGGIKDGKKFKAVQIGGPSGGCLTEEHLDLPLDYDSLKHVGAIMGSGGLVVMDEDTCMAEVARFFMKFTQKESCGKCIPCREGTKRMLEALRQQRGKRRGYRASRGSLRHDLPYRALRSGSERLQARAVHAALLPRGLRAPCARQILPALQRQTKGIADRSGKVQGVQPVRAQLPGGGDHRRGQEAVRDRHGKVHPLQRLRQELQVRRDSGGVKIWQRGSCISTVSASRSTGRKTFSPLSARRASICRRCATTPISPFTARAVCALWRTIGAASTPPAPWSRATGSPSRRTPPGCSNTAG